MTNHTHNDDHDGGLIHDLPLLTRRSLVAGLGLAGVGVLLTGCGFGGQGEANKVASAADGTSCIKDPVETSGPFPADGTNSKSGQTVNALTASGVVRSDIRPCFGDLTGTADGVQLDLEITLVDVNAACAPLGAHAIYIWHADPNGHYSLYDLPEKNYLRGVGVTDDKGVVKFTSVLPGCYDGRWPHIHFEVFKNLESAVSGDKSLLISQFAIPQQTASAVYAADARYVGSTANLGNVSIAKDMVFGDNTPEQITAQTLKFAGDAATGLQAKGTIAV
jgi:protocatechuate 3,4-dioxygenase beta subunit